MTDEETIKALCAHITELEKALVLVEQLREARREYERSPDVMVVIRAERELRALRDKLELGE